MPPCLHSTPVLGVDPAVLHGMARDSVNAYVQLIMCRMHGTEDEAHLYCAHAICGDTAPAVAHSMSLPPKRCLRLSTCRAVIGPHLTRVRCFPGQEVLDALEEGSPVRKKWVTGLGRDAAAAAPKTLRHLRCQLQGTAVVVQYWHQVTHTSFFAV